MELADIVARQRGGFSLEQPFYTDPAIFDREFDAIFGREWHLVDHESRITEPGAYIACEIAGESLIVVRDRDGSVNALFNVCRHRGSRICETEHGRLNQFTCRYHGWTYDLDGRLKVWRHMPAHLRPEDYGLVTAPVRVLNGLIFVYLGRDACANFADIEALASPLLAAHGISAARVAHTKRYRMAANWKLAVENFHECYHCPSSHPQYTSIYAFVRAEEKLTDSADFQALTAEWQALARRLGHPVLNASKEHARLASGGWAYRSPIRRGFLTGTEDGQPVAPLMGIYAAYDGGHTGLIFNYLTGLAGYNDYAVAVRFVPVDVATTDALFSWLVRADAEPGRDYDPERLIWLWDITMRQDAEIIERNARGVASRRYAPGPYSELEPETRGFVAWYLARMASGSLSDGCA